MSGADVGITVEFEGSEMGEMTFWQMMLVSDDMKKKKMIGEAHDSPHPLGAQYYLRYSEKRIWILWVLREERKRAQRRLWRVCVLFLALRPLLPLHPFVLEPLALLLSSP